MLFAVAHKLHFLCWIFLHANLFVFKKEIPIMQIEHYAFHFWVRIRPQAMYLFAKWAFWCMPQEVRSISGRWWAPANALTWTNCWCCSLLLEYKTKSMAWISNAFFKLSLYTKINKWEQVSFVCSENKGDSTFMTMTKKKWNRMRV